VRHDLKAGTTVTDPSSPLVQARAHYLAGQVQAARQALEARPHFDLDGAPLLALCWVRQVLSDCPHGVYVDAPVLQAALAAPFDHPRLDGDRRFALGWLHWLAGDPARAEPPLAEAVEALLPEKAAGEAAYWLARVRLALGRGDALGEYERALRGSPAGPQGTCWFVDLLWRAGQLDRAEGVWKTVRGNRRVLACDEAPLLEARPMVRRGEAGPAEQVLAGASPRGGVVQAERLLLLAWALAAQNRTEQAIDLLRQAEAWPYPAAALQDWQRLFQLRSGAAPSPEGLDPEASGPRHDWVAGQQARAEGRREEAVAALRAAQAAAPLAPFARYALACLGADDFAAVPAGQPGLFLAARCRARLALDRFCRREASPAELLEALQAAEAAGYRPDGLEHFRRLALALKQRTPHAEDLRRLADGPAADGEAAGRNVLRAAVEVAARLLPPAEATELLREWAAQDRLRRDEVLRTAVGRQLLRLALMVHVPDDPVGLAAALGAARAESAAPRAAAQQALDPTSSPEAVLRSAETLLGADPAVALVREWLGAPGEAPPSPSGDAAAPPLARLWRAAVQLRQGGYDVRRWREDVAGLRSAPRLRGVAQCLLLQEAAGRGDVAGVAALLADGAAWQGFPSGPPRFVLRAVRATLGAQPAEPRWRPVLARWLQVWHSDSLGPEAHPIAVQAGLVRQDAGTGEAPAGVPAVPWLLHQAAQGLTRDDAREALGWVRRALADDPDFTAAGEGAAAVRAALPELERLARAQFLADVVRLDPEQPPVAPRLLVDMLDGLDALPAGLAVLAAAAVGDLTAAREALAALAEKGEVAPRLAHHLALVYHRAALFFDGRERTEEAEPCWRRAWRCWLRSLAAPPSPLWGEGPEEEGGHPLLAHLLGLHRRRIDHLLARGEVEAARRHWAVVQGLPELARSLGNGPARVIEALAARFREELAAEHLAAGREAMRYGDVKEGWRADYEKGLAPLVRLLSLDRDNLRLLGALVEVCNDWFRDCYANEDGGRLREAVERFTPFALRLARLPGRRPGDVAVAAALAEFYKFRGFVAPERDRRIALYREALHFDPANANVRELLEQAESLLP
jgi:hypothetical protein